MSNNTTKKQKHESYHFFWLEDAKLFQEALENPSLEDAFKKFGEKVFEKSYSDGFSAGEKHGNDHAELSYDEGYDDGYDAYEHEQANKKD